MSVFDQIIWDDRDFDTELYQEAQRKFSQEGRPHIFVRKLPDRPQKRTVLDRRYNPSWHIGVSEFGSIYPAAKFAVEHDLHLDMHRTVDFGRMGVHDPLEVQKELSGLIRCYVEWGRDNDIPTAWIYTVEMSRTYEYHSHIAVHVPGDTADGMPGFRRKFRKWAREYTRRRGTHIPRAIKVRGGSRQSELEHWIIFHYLVKGFDRQALLCSARNSPDGMDVRLGDIIARWYRDPGPIRLNRRVGVSNNIGPSRRAFGAPTGFDHLLEQRIDWTGFDFDANHPMTNGDKRITPKTCAVPTPYRSPFEDGIYDVRRLYSDSFYELVTKMPARPSEELASELEPEEGFDLTEHLRSLVI